MLKVDQVTMMINFNDDHLIRTMIKLYTDDQVTMMNRSISSGSHVCRVL